MIQTELHCLLLFPCFKELRAVSSSFCCFCCCCELFRLVAALTRQVAASIAPCMQSGLQWSCYHIEWALESSEGRYTGAKVESVHTSERHVSARVGPQSSACLAVVAVELVQTWFCVSPWCCFACARPPYWLGAPAPRLVFCSILLRSLRTL